MKRKFKRKAKPVKIVGKVSDQEYQLTDKAKRVGGTAIIHFLEQGNDQFVLKTPNRNNRDSVNFQDNEISILSAHPELMEHYHEEVITSNHFGSPSFVMKDLVSGNYQFLDPMLGVNRNQDKRIITLSDSLDPFYNAFIISAIAKELKIIHDKEYVHFDVDPRNIAIHSDTGKARMTDFGIMRKLEQKLRYIANETEPTSSSIGYEFNRAREEPYRNLFFSPPELSQIGASGKDAVNNMDTYMLMEIYTLMSTSGTMQHWKKVAAESGKPLEEIIRPMFKENGYLPDEVYRNITEVLVKGTSNSGDRYQNCDDVIKAIEDLDLNAKERVMSGGGARSPTFAVGFDYKKHSKEVNKEINSGFFNRYKKKIAIAAAVVGLAVGGYFLGKSIVNNLSATDAPVKVEEVVDYDKSTTELNDVKEDDGRDIRDIDDGVKSGSIEQEKVEEIKKAKKEDNTEDTTKFTVLDPFIIYVSNPLDYSSLNRKLILDLQDKYRPRVTIDSLLNTMKPLKLPEVKEPVIEDEKQSDEDSNPDNQVTAEICEIEEEKTIPKKKFKPYIKFKEPDIKTIKEDYKITLDLSAYFKDNIRSKLKYKKTFCQDRLESCEIIDGSFLEVVPKTNYYSSAGDIEHVRVVASSGDISEPGMFKFQFTPINDFPVASSSKFPSLYLPAYFKEKYRTSSSFNIKGHFSDVDENDTLSYFVTIGGKKAKPIADGASLEFNSSQGNIKIVREGEEITVFSPKSRGSLDLKVIASDGNGKLSEMPSKKVNLNFYGSKGTSCQVRDTDEEYSISVLAVDKGLSDHYQFFNNPTCTGHSYPSLKKLAGTLCSTVEVIKEKYGVEPLQGIADLVVNSKGELEVNGIMMSERFKKRDYSDIFRRIITQSLGDVTKHKNTCYRVTISKN